MRRLLHKREQLLLRNEFGLEIPMICTGEVFGQGNVCFSHPDPQHRQEAIAR